MSTLIIETSTEKSIIALIENGKIFYEKQLPYGLKNSKYALTYISEGLTKLSLKPSELHHIILGVGPGSFTGIRIGAIIAKTLSWTHKIPLIGLSSFYSFLPEELGSFAIAFDAKIAGLHLLFGNRTDNGLHLCPPVTLSVEQAKPKLQKTSLLLSPHAERLPLPFVNKDPNPLQLFALAQPKIQNKEYSTCGDVDLVYLR